MSRQRAASVEEKAPSSSVMSFSHAEIHDFFDRFAAALTRGDGATIATLWETPALVLADAGARAVNSPKEVEEFYSIVKEQYTLQGIRGTRAEVVRLERPSQRILQVLVRWPYIDRDGQEQGNESTTYILRLNDAGEPKVRMAIVEAAGTNAHTHASNGWSARPPRRTNGPHESR